MKTRATGVVFLLMMLLQAKLFAFDMELEKKKMERDLEDRISSEIRRYFTDLNFLVTAEVTLVDLTPPAKKQQPTDNRDFLLPGVSGFQSQTPAEQTQEPEKQQFGIESIVIKLLIDKNRTPEEKDLLTNIAFYTGKLNKVRGDRVDIQEMSFPASTLQLQREQQRADQERRIAELEKQDSALLAAQQKTTSEVTPKTAEQPTLNTTTLLLAALGVLILILIIVLLARGRKAQPAEMLPQQGMQPMASGVPGGGAGEELETGAQPVMPEPGNEFQEAIEVDKIRSSLVVTCAGESDLTSNVIRDLIPDAGQRDKLTVIINQLGNNVLQVMRDHFSIEEMRALQNLTLEKQERTPAEVHEALSFFQNQLAVKRFSEARSAKQNPFAFLEKLSEPQLYLLMKDEPPGIIAIILSQLSTPVASSMLKNLPSMQQGEVALELGKLRRLTSDTYVSVAKQLAAKAATIPVINNVQVQGTDLLLDIFDNIDENSESSIIEFIKVVNLDLYREISSQRVSFSAINQLDESMLRQIVKDISGDEIAIALKNAPKEISERFLSVLPSKSRIILEDRLTSMKAVSPDDELKARRRITRMVRQYIKSGGVPAISQAPVETGEEEAGEPQVQ
ncbi:MAG TPA: FliG C-terminal domain-containing protein [Bacteroidota bacterium]|nr:FliG C-terminal domain-containing protein [Bacteroidota bacterium]